MIGISIAFNGKQNISLIGGPCLSGSGRMEEVKECARTRCGGGNLPIDCVYGEWRPPGVSACRDRCFSLWDDHGKAVGLSATMGHHHIIYIYLLYIYINNTM